MKRLPGCLYQPCHGELAPELYDRLIIPSRAWSMVCRDYTFDDKSAIGFSNFGSDIKERAAWNNAPVDEQGYYAKSMKHNIEHGDVVYIDTKSLWNPLDFAFYINHQGCLVSNSGYSAFKLDGANRIIRYYEQAITSRRGQERPAATVRPLPQQPQKAKQQLHTLNSKAVGRLLAAGGFYNGNAEGFRKTAEQLGGDAPSGYEQVMDKKGLLIAGSSIAAGLGIGRLNTAREIGGISNYQKTPVLESTHLRGFTSEKGILLNAEHAVIDPKKLSSYALNSEHPVGGNKAKVFESALGYNQSNADILVDRIQQGIMNNPATLGLNDKFGQRMTVDMPITGINGKTATVRTGWMYETDSLVPRMTTIYVK